MLSTILGIMLFMMMIPGTVRAAESYDVMIYTSRYSFTQVTSDNMHDVLNDGTISYDPSTCTLTLDGAKIDRILTYGNESKTLTINVVSDSTITANGNGISLQASSTAGPVFHRDKLILTGKGKLTITTQKSGQIGISAFDDTIIENANIEITTTSTPITVADQNGAPGGDLTVRNSHLELVVTGTEGNGFWIQNGDLTIDNSTVEVNASGSDNPALWVLNKTEIIGDSTLTINSGYGNAIYTQGDLLLDASKLFVYDQEWAAPMLYIEGSVTIQNQSQVEALSKGDCGMYTEGSIQILNSTLETSGLYNGIITNGDLLIKNAKLTSTAQEGGSIYVTNQMNVITSTLKAVVNDPSLGTAITYDKLTIDSSDVEAIGGIMNQYVDSKMRIDGDIMDIKVDTDAIGTNAADFQEAPYEQLGDLNDAQINALSDYAYVHIYPHIHTGGVANCTSKAICEKCLREYGDIDPNNHSFTNYIYNDDADCTSNGTETAKCDRCNEYHTREKENSALGHDVIANEAKAPTCLKEGNIAYWYCQRCQKYFIDETLKTEVKSEETVIAPLGHQVTKKEAKAPTCLKDGNIAYWYCDRCDKYYSDADLKNEISLDKTVLNALGHDYQNGKCTRCNAKDPTFEVKVPDTAIRDSNDRSILVLALLGLLILPLITKTKSIN